LLLLSTALLSVPTWADLSRPNIVVILTDDQGYADISINPESPTEVATPHMDALAKEGVWFSNGYTSGHVCSPTRAGLMLGGYQQREGIYTAGQGGSGFDPTVPIFPAMLPEEYVSTAIGKWHLGLDEDFPELKWHALSRGFDECYKFMGRGAHDYFELKGAKSGGSGIYRNKERLTQYEGYLTNVLTDEATAFIERQKGSPFFLYLAYNAVHSPAQAPQEDIDRYRAKFPYLTEKRAILMAMLEHLDDGVGSVVKKLKDTGEWDNTLLFLLTDNGGSKAMEAHNGSLRAFKGSLYEGGIRTPFIVSWPDKFDGGQKIDTPVMSFDILPTVLAAMDIDRPVDSTFDGKSLLPLLTTETTDHHDILYWNSGPPKGEWAVRKGNWKAHGYTNKPVELYDLSADPSESNDLALTNPEKAKELSDLHVQWLAEMKLDEHDGKVPDAVADPDKQNLSKEERAERKAAREARKKAD